MKKTNRCPICERPLTPFIGFRGGLIYQCNNCGYRGPLSVSIESKKRKVKKGKKMKKRVRRKR